VLLSEVELSRIKQEAEKKPILGHLTLERLSKQMPQLAAMNARIVLPLALVIAELGLTLVSAAPPEIFARTNLVAWCIVPFDARKRGPEERAQMLDRLGIKRLAYDWRAEHVPTFDAEMEACQRHGISDRLVVFHHAGQRRKKFSLR
jgi:hypothetical protein